MSDQEAAGLTPSEDVDPGSLGNLLAGAGTKKKKKKKKKKGGMSLGDMLGAAEESQKKKKKNYDDEEMGSLMTDAAVGSADPWSSKSKAKKKKDKTIDPSILAKAEAATQKAIQKEKDEQVDALAAMIIAQVNAKEAAKKEKSVSAEAAPTGTFTFEHNNTINRDIDTLVSNQQVDDLAEESKKTSPSEKVNTSTPQAAPVSKNTQAAASASKILNKENRISTLQNPNTLTSWDSLGQAQELKARGTTKAQEKKDKNRMKGNNTGITTITTTSQRLFSKNNNPETKYNHGTQQSVWETIMVFRQAPQYWDGSADDDTRATWWVWKGLAAMVAVYYILQMLFG